MHPRTALIAFLWVLSLVATAPGQTGPLSVYCPSNIAVTAAAGQASVTVNYPAPVATPGAQVTTSPPSGSAFPLGETSVAVTASEGTNVENCAFTVMVLAADDFGLALEATKLTWATFGDSAWFVETTVTHDSLAAAQSGVVSAGQESTLYTVLVGPGTLDFWWYSPSQAYVLVLRLDGVQDAYISADSGYFDWEEQKVDLGPGMHLVEWTFTFGGSGGWWPGAGYIDQVSYNGPTGPLDVLCPSNVVVVAAPGQASATVNYLGPLATMPGAALTASQTSGSAFPLGDTTVSVIASEGTNTASCAFDVTVLTTDDFGRALNATNLAWGTSGDAPWFVETAVAHGGPAAAQSGAISAGQASTLYTVLDGPGKLSFWWTVQSQWDRSVLSLKVDGVTNAAVTGGMIIWVTPDVVDLGAGVHLVEWTFAENPAGDPGPSSCWLDEVTYTGQAGALAVFCPSNIAVMATPGQASATVRYAVPLATPGAVVATSQASGSVFALGDTSVVVTASDGSNVASCTFTVSVLATNDFARALGATNLTWTTNGDAAWFVETAVAHDGLAAVESGPITNNQVSTLQTTLTGPGVLTFWWKVSSEANHDFLYLSVNGSTQAVISGEVDWQPQTVYLGSGPQLVEWTYSKDASGSAGQDAGWLDQANYAPGPVAPFISAHPASLAVAPGLTVALSVTAAGTPPLAYQWLFNGQSIPGATNTSLAITNFQAPDAGTYSVVVTSPVGTVLSGGAALTLSQVAAWGADTFGQTDAPLNLTNVIAITGGWHHSVALMGDGRVTVWGDNNAGQTNVPANLSNVVAIASRSGDHIMALRADGTVVDWGDNTYGEKNVPAGLSNVVAIAPGGYQCLVLKADGTAVAWGSPNGVPAGLSNVVAIAAGDYANLCLRDNGTVAGAGTGIPPGLSNIVAIAAGGYHYLALRADGTVVGWGENSQGQLNIPAGLTNVVAIGAGDYHSLALRADGTVAVWGSYANDQDPNAVTFFPAAAPVGLTNVVAAAPGSDHDLALLGAGPPLPQLKPMDIGYTGGLFSCSVPTQSGRVYRLEYKNTLADARWTALPLTAGNGRVQVLSDGTAAGAQRFYRVRRW